MTRHTIITVALTFVATTLLWFVLLYGLYMHFYGDEPPFRVALQYPAEVALGSEFEIKIAIEVSGSDWISLGSIDLYDSLMKGFELVGSRPAYLSTDELFNFHTLWYQTELPRNAPLELRIKLKAIQVGRHGGQLDICAPSEVCTTAYATIAVAAAR